VPEPNTGFVAVAGGEGHSLGLKSDGSIVAWGQNVFGQCDVSAPNTGFVAIAAGEWHSAGLRSDGTIAAWGRNDEGQCDVSAPNQDFLALAAGGKYCLSVKSSTATAAGKTLHDFVPGASALTILSLVPNPFNPSTQILFETRTSGRVTMEIYNVDGSRVVTVPVGHVGPGTHWTQWDGRDASGEDVASGVYFVRLRGGRGESQTVKAVVIR
jgi:hypothetical protein